MQWLNELPFAENRVLQIGFLAACGIAALIVLAIFYRLTFAHRLRVPGGRTRQPRLGLVDAFSLDGQRQLVLVRRDNIEHLVMIGGPNDVLVESQINRAVSPGARKQPGLASARAGRAGAANRSCGARSVSGSRTGGKGRRQARFAARSTPGCNSAGRAASAGSSWAAPGRSDRRTLDPQGARSRPADRSSPCPVLSCRPNVRARAGASVPRCAGGAARPRAGPAGAATSTPKRLSRLDQRRKFTGASGGGASRTTARDDAPADHPRERLTEPWDPGSRHGNGSHERSGQSSGLVSCHAYGAGAAGEGGARSRWLKSGAAGRDG